MNVDDIIYLSLLAFSMVFGLYYRKLKNANFKKKIGALVGLVIVFIVSGWHTFHVLIITAVNACIILSINQKICHVFSFAFSFLYLFFFRTTIYFGIPYPPAHTNLVQMMATLKLVGLAFEINSSNTLKKNEDSDKTEEQKLEDETCIIDLEFWDVFYYVFNYCGVLTGPYFRYRTFTDHLNKPYHLYDDFKPAFIKKSYYLPLLGSLHLITNHYWPISYIFTDEFLNRSLFYRAWYVWPTFLIFRSRIYFGLILTELVCLLGGLGVYPVFSAPRSGHGPCQNFKKLKELTDSEELKKTEYNYETTHCLDPYKADFAPTMREAMKYWNITIQYWLAIYIYKRFPYKKYRTATTMLISAVWHGMYAGYYFCIATVPIALIYEDLWAKLVLKDNTGLALKLSKGLMLFLKMQMFSYQAMAFVLLELGRIFYYYNCVYHVIPIIYIGIYLLGRFF